MLERLARGIDRDELRVALADDALAFRDQLLEMRDMRGLAVQCGVAILEQPVEAHHLGGIGLRARKLGVVAVGVQRNARRGRGSAPGVAAAATR